MRVTGWPTPGELGEAVTVVVVGLRVRQPRSVAVVAAQSELGGVGSGGQRRRLGPAGVTDAE